MPPFAAAQASDSGRAVKAVKVLPYRASPAQLDKAFTLRYGEKPCGMKEPTSHPAAPLIHD